MLRCISNSPYLTNSAFSPSSLTLCWFLCFLMPFVFLFFFVNDIVIFVGGMVGRISCSSGENDLVKCFVMIVICSFSDPAMLLSSCWTFCFLVLLWLEKNN